jgi:hypothetical protein
MIDLHTHILPEIDDGAANLKDALRMANCRLVLSVLYASAIGDLDFGLSILDVLVAMHKLLILFRLQFLNRFHQPVIYQNWGLHPIWGDPDTFARPPEF